MKTKEQLLLAMDATREDFLQAIAGLDPEQIVYEESGWRVKDITAHVVTWETEMLRSLHTYRRGGAYQIENYDLNDFNGFAANSKMHNPIEQTLGEWDTIRTWIGIHFNALPSESLDDEMMMPWGERESVRDLFESIHEHVEEHLADIRAKVVAQSSDALP